MKQRPRIYYTETDEALMWHRWQKGEVILTVSVRSGLGYQPIHK